MSNAVAVKRQTNIDLLRITACFFVILLHVSASCWGQDDMYQRGWIGMITYVVSPRCCVPLFLMISGKLFLDRKNAVPVPKLLLNYVLKLVILYVAWGFFYAADDLGLGILFSKDCLEIPKRFVALPKYHLWYLPFQTCVYLMIPVFWALVKYEKGKYLGYTCALICVFGVVYSNMKLFVPDANYVYGFLDSYGTFLNITCAYFLLGYYFTVKKMDKLKVWHCLLVFLLSVAVATAYTVWSTRMSGVYEERLLENHSITTFVATIALFLAFLKMPCNFSERTGKIIAVVSRCTLFIYLAHPFVLDRIEWVGISASAFNPWLCIPAVAFLIFVVCLIPALVLTRIPVVNKWLL